MKHEQPNEMNFDVKLVDPDQLTSRTQSESKSKSHPPNDQVQAMNQDHQKFNLSKAAHPISCVFTFLFKLLAVICYFILSFWISQLLTFIIVLLLCVFDFWVVKNVTGRLLVGLRWWINLEEGESYKWKYETYNRQYEPNKVDSTFFWFAQIAFTILWAALTLLNAITFDFFWFFLSIINLFLAGLNLYGYYNCRKEYAKKLKKFKEKLVQEGVAKVAQVMF